MKNFLMIPVYMVVLDSDDAFNASLNFLFLPLKICVWSSEGWEKKMNTFLPIPVEQTQVAQSGTRVQFHQDQIHFLAVNEMQLAIYETTKLECMKQV